MRSVEGGLDIMNYQMENLERFEKKKTPPPNSTSNKDLEACMLHLPSLNCRPKVSAKDV